MKTGAQILDLEVQEASRSDDRTALKKVHAAYLTLLTLLVGAVVSLSFVNFDSNEEDSLNCLETEESSTFVYHSNIEQVTGGVGLFIIDPQQDFMDTSTAALGVPGATADSVLLSQLIQENNDVIEEIYVTLDTHASYHIAHPNFWKHTDGNPVTPFTTITSDSIGVNKSFVPYDETLLEYSIEYTKLLESDETRDRLGFTDDSSPFSLFIWPEHCIVGSVGHAIQQDVFDAIQAWEAPDTVSGRGSRNAHMVMKGANSLTEHFSAFRPEYIRDDDPKTEFNEELFESLMQHKTILVAGQASSHCVNYSMRDLIEHLKVYTGEVLTEEIIILQDTMSPVAGFEEAEIDFFTYMQSNSGVKNVTITISSTNAFDL